MTTWLQLVRLWFVRRREVRMLRDLAWAHGATHHYGAMVRLFDRAAELERMPLRSRLPAARARRREE